MDQLNQRKSVMLTERDFSLLQSLYGNVVMSFPQITKMHFASKSKPTIVNRLTKLEASGLITKYKMPRLEVTGSSKVISVVFQISRSGIWALQKRFPETEYRRDAVRLRPYGIDHDLLLVDVMEAFKNKIPDCKIIHGELYSVRSIASGLKPDAILIQPNGMSRVALELELTVKSEKRYRELILKYRLSKDFDRVIYVISHRQIESKIKSILGPTNTTERFEFLRLADVLKDKPVLENNNSLHQFGERKELCEL